jgi:hypothetical protein
MEYLELLPAISTYLVINGKDNGDPEFYLEGLWYPIIIATVCFAVGMIYIKIKILKYSHLIKSYESIKKF